jgi:hypothetical protein
MYEVSNNLLKDAHQKIAYLTEDLKAKDDAHMEELARSLAKACEEAKGETEAETRKIEARVQELQKSLDGALEEVAAERARSTKAEEKLASTRWALADAAAAIAVATTVTPQALRDDITCFLNFPENMFLAGRSAIASNARAFDSIASNVRASDGIAFSARAPDGIAFSARAPDGIASSARAFDGIASNARASDGIAFSARASDEIAFSARASEGIARGKPEDMTFHASPLSPLLQVRSDQLSPLTLRQKCGGSVANTAPASRAAAGEEVGAIGADAGATTNPLEAVSCR